MRDARVGCRGSRRSRLRRSLSFPNAAVFGDAAANVIAEDDGRAPAGAVVVAPSPDVVPATGEAWCWRSGRAKTELVAGLVARGLSAGNGPRPSGDRDGPREGRSEGMRSGRFWRSFCPGAALACRGCAWPCGCGAVPRVGRFRHRRSVARDHSSVPPRWALRAACAVDETRRRIVEPLLAALRACADGLYCAGNILCDRIFPSSSRSPPSRFSAPAAAMTQQTAVSADGGIWKTVDRGPDLDQQRAYIVPARHGRAQGDGQYGRRVRGRIVADPQDNLPDFICRYGRERSRLFV